MKSKAVYAMALAIVAAVALASAASADSIMASKTVRRKCVDADGFCEAYNYDGTPMYLFAKVRMGVPRGATIQLSYARPGMLKFASFLQTAYYSAADFR